MSGVEIVGSGTTTGKIDVQVAFEWRTERPQTQLVVDGSRALLNEDEALELARWLMQCVGNASSQRAQSEAILRAHSGRHQLEESTNPAANPGVRRIPCSP